MKKMVAIFLLMTIGTVLTHCPQYMSNDVELDENSKPKRTPDYLIQLMGSATKEISHDEVIIKLKSKATGPDSKKALEYLNLEIQKVIDAIVGLGIDRADLSTAAFRINRIHTPLNPDQRRPSVSKPFYNVAPPSKILEKICLLS
jgi:uncharacterized protein YggE